MSKLLVFPFIVPWVEGAASEELVFPIGILVADFLGTKSDRCGTLLSFLASLLSRHLPGSCVLSVYVASRVLGFDNRTRGGMSTTFSQKQSHLLCLLSCLSAECLTIEILIVNWMLH